MKTKRLYIKSSNNYIHLFYSIIITLVVVFLGFGYSAFGSDLTLNDIAVSIRVDRDIRVKAYRISELSEGVISKYEEYNINNVSTSLKLPSLNSYGIYEVEIYNYGNTEYGILNIENSNPNLKYEIIGYKVGNILCDDIDENKCSLGSKTTFNIKIMYEDNVNVIDESQDITLTFKFVEPHSITYYGIDDTNLPKKVLDGANFIQEFDVESSRMKTMMGGVAIALGVDEDYTYQNNILTIKNVTSDL